MGRLKPGARLEQARESLNGAFQAMALEVMPPPRREMNRRNSTRKITRAWSRDPAARD